MMSADASHVVSLRGAVSGDLTARVREGFFLLLTALMFLSLANLIVDREYLKIYKYFCWLALAGSLVVAVFTCSVRQLPTLGSLFAIAFGLIGYVVVALAQFHGGLSVGAALIPFSLCTLGYLTMGRGTGEVQRLINVIFAACAIVVVEAVVAPRDNFFRINEFSFVLVFGLVFAILLRKLVTAAAICFVIAAILVGRPSSTLFVGAAAGGSLAICAVLFGTIGVRLVAGLVIFTCAGLAVTAMSDPELAFSVGDLETFVKETILGGESNSQIRAHLIAAAQENFSKASVLFGHFFLADPHPDLSDIYGVYDIEAPLHADFVQMLYQGGMIGLGAFCYFLVELTFLHRKPEPSPEADVLSHAVPVCTAVFALYISFNPIMLNIEYTIWFFMLSFVCLGLPPAEKAHHIGEPRF